MLTLCATVATCDLNFAWAQICETRVGREHGVQAWQSIEAIQSRVLDHPSIVKTYAHTTVMIKVPTVLATLTTINC